MSIERSEQVVAAYKKHKLTVSAMRQIRKTLQRFDQDRNTDKRLAGVGLAIILLLVGYSIYSLLSADRITLF